VIATSQSQKTNQSASNSYFESHNLLLKNGKKVARYIGKNSKTDQATSPWPIVNKRKRENWTREI